MREEHVRVERAGVVGGGGCSHLGVRAVRRPKCALRLRRQLQGRILRLHRLPVVERVLPPALLARDARARPAAARAGPMRCCRRLRGRQFARALVPTLSSLRACKRRLLRDTRAPRRRVRAGGRDAQQHDQRREHRRAKHALAVRMEPSGACAIIHGAAEAVAAASRGRPAGGSRDCRGVCAWLVHTTSRKIPWPRACGAFLRLWRGFPGNGTTNLIELL